MSQIYYAATCVYSLVLYQLSSTVVRQVDLTIFKFPPLVCPPMTAETVVCLLASYYLLAAVLCCYLLLLFVAAVAAVILFFCFILLMLYSASTEGVQQHVLQP